MPNAETISVEEAGRRLGIGRNLAYRLAQSGEIPALRLGGKRLVVPTRALDRMLGEVPTSEDAGGGKG